MRMPSGFAPFWILSSLSTLCLLLQGTVQGNVVINEIHYDPEPNTEAVEFIELYNNGSESVDLSHWQFTDGVRYSLPESTSLAPGAYLIIAENPHAILTKFGVSALGPWTGKLSNEGETITLKNPLGETIDTVDYGVGFPWPLGARGTGSSMELIHPSLDNDLGGSWRASGEPSVCAGSGASSTFISKESIQWRYHKGTSDPSDDDGGLNWWQDFGFVENSDWATATAPMGYGESHLNTFISDMYGNYSTLFLRKTFTVGDASAIEQLQLSLRYDDGIKIWINGSPVYQNLAPGEAANPSPHTATATDSRSESDGAIYISQILETPEDYLVDGNNLIAVQMFNQRLTSGDCHFDLELSEVANSGSGGDSSPSPMAQNHSYSSKAAPQVRQVQHLPEQPAAGEAVVISAKCTDPNGIQSVELAYQIVDPGTYIRRSDADYEDASEWIKLNMVDTGNQGDLAAGDAIYSVTIPGSVQVHRRLIRYRITVTDTLNHCMRLPYGDDTQANFAYFCYNGLPSWSGKIDSGSAQVTYSSAELGRLPVYHLIANNTDIENSQWNGSYNEQYFEGTLVYDGKVYDHIKFRNKGSGSTYRMGHNKWKLNFNRGHRFQAKDDYGKKMAAEWDKFSIQTGESPWWRNDRYPMSGMLFQESLMSKVNNLAGAHATKMFHFHFRVIDDASESSPSSQYDGDFWGIYTAQQHPDRSFFEQHDLPTGNLYKLNVSGSTNGATASKWYQDGSQVDDASDLSAFITGYKSTNSAQWWADNLELPVYYTWNTLNLALNNSDLRKEQNVIYWHNSETDRWHPSIWDVDLLFEDAQHHNRDPYAWWEDLHRSLDHPEYFIAYQNRVRELQDLLLWNGQYDRSVDEIVTLLSGSSSGTTTNTLVDANQAMWNQHPRKRYQGNWYRIEGSSYWNGFADMANYMRDFPKPGSFGGDQLESKSQANADSSIPGTPSISYHGTPGHPTSNITLESSSFQSNGGQVAQIQWRVGEIYDPNLSHYTPGDPWKYEITPVWESGSAAWDGNTRQIQVPPSQLKVGKTYRARVRHQDQTGRWSRWSAPLEFTSTAPDISLFRNTLVVSEIHYHPLGPTTPGELGASLDPSDFEFIELMNVGSQPLDLNAVRIADGISFDFTGADITTLEPGARVLVVKDKAAFESRYGTGQPIAGEFDKSLSNGGETLRLSYGDGNSAGNLIREFTYDDISPWPEAADGTGASLVLQDPWSLPDHNIASNWRASHSNHGQPGVVDSWNFQAWLRSHGIPDAGANDDPDLDGLPHLAEYFLGTHPLEASMDQAPKSAFRDLSISETNETYFTLGFQRNMNADDLSFTVQESGNLIDWNTSGTPLEIERTPLTPPLESLHYRSALPSEDYPDGKLFMRLEIRELPES
ncbi:lamin tail domain-containing protein [Verrucomicrobiaceae bacterium N1E253]|uniref:Lamin tail domain-containing protein n=1 Tax=Oceaniferula marina TaxID=2748318 RepID=A0A851GNU1_9BACT|nr:lamin tail domain-containing protein [Oceaniferula marina]NWK57521.1 lamin tail domain-containing protein [Oceaniferula marina]